MKRTETGSSGISEAQIQNHDASFQAVRDTRKRKILSLRQRCQPTPAMTTRLTVNNNLQSKRGTWMRIFDSL